MRTILLLFLVLLSCFFTQFAHADKGADSSIRDIILALIGANDETSALHVAVDVNGGYVSVVANTDTLEQATMLVKIADSVKNVIDVNAGRVRIKGVGQIPDDNLIAAKVVGTLVRANVFGDLVDVSNFPITVNANQGIIFLIGNVQTRSQINDCINLSRKVPGVMRVISELNVTFAPVRMGG